MDSSTVGKKTIFIAISIFCLTQWVGPSLALLLGIVVAVSMGSIFKVKSVSNLTNWLLKASVVGLGFDMDFKEAVEAGKNGLFFTIITIVTTLVSGYYLGRKMKVDNKITTLISSGTAICGGSAIAAMTPVIDANNHQFTVSLGTVFILNSVALFVFPSVGNYLHLTQTQFGYWAAIAIHDTSSVVGAASIYGSQALEIATSVKLQRALWILPLVFWGSYFYSSERSYVSIPYFVLLFAGATLFNTFVPSITAHLEWIVVLAKKGLILTLFLIGTGITLRVIKKVGVRPLMTGVLLWVFIAIGSLLMIIKSPM